MVMTKKDFIKQAMILKSIRSDSVRKRITNEQIKVFKKANPKFDPKRFRNAVEGRKFKR